MNFAPPDWLPWGCSILSKYRRDRKAATLSNDALLVALVQVTSQAPQALDSQRLNLNPRFLTLWASLGMPTLWADATEP